MAIGTATAIMGAASIGGALLGAKSQKKAAKSAAKAQTQASQQQLQLGRETNALNREIYDKNSATLDPYVQRGNVAGASYNALLGLPAAPQTQAPVVRPQQPQQQQPTSMGGMIAASRGWSDYSAPQDSMYPQEPQQMAPQQPQQPAVTQPSAMDAFNNFANSAGMKFQMQEGANSLNNLYAGSGALNSGAAMKAMQDYGQNTALNNYFMPYMGMLDGQQRIGAGAASSAAGVGQNFVNSASNIMGHQSDAIQGRANALSDRAAVNGVANSKMWSGIGSALGTMGSSFGAPKGGGMGGGFNGGIGAGYTPYSIRGIPSFGAR